MRADASLIVSAALAEPGMSGKAACGDACHDSGCHVVSRGTKRLIDEVDVSDAQIATKLKHDLAVSGMLVLDIGANFGQSSERYLLEGCRVVAIEPNPVAAASMRSRLRPYIDSGHLVVEESAVWSIPGAEIVASSSSGKMTSCKGAVLYVNEEDSEWSSLYMPCGRRFNTAAREVQVTTTTLAALWERHGVPHYVKMDTEGADGVCLSQLRGLTPPPYVSFELNSLACLTIAIQLGYDAFKIVPQSGHQADHLQDRYGRPLTHAGPFGEACKGVGGNGSWRDGEETLADCKRICLVHDAEADVEEFVKGPPRFVERDFATLQACFPVESRNDEEWYDVHCRHVTAEFASVHSRHGREVRCGSSSRGDLNR